MLFGKKIMTLLNIFWKMVHMYNQNVNRNYYKINLKI